MVNLNDTTQTDLSEGQLSYNEPLLAKDILKDQQQKRNFRLLSFALAWLIAAFFLLSVLCFSYRIVSNPYQYWPSSASQHDAGKNTLPVSNGKAATSSREDENHAITNKSDDHAVDATSFHTDPINQLLVLLGLLSAVGTTLAVSVMRFSFSNQSNSPDKESPAPISPIATSISEALKALVEIFKKD